MFISLSIAGLAVLCIAPAILDALEDRRFRRDFSREQQSETEHALRLAKLADDLQVERLEEKARMFIMK